jgi:hypothetical protein
MRLRMLAVTLVTISGGIVVSELPAMAYAYCERYANSPTFSGSQISGELRVTCSRKVREATLHGRIKEDRNNLPDIVHDTESDRFTDDIFPTVSTSTCQDDDDIYIEAQINTESPAQSSRVEMNC